MTESAQERIMPVLMFEGAAQAAVDLYTSLLGDEVQVLSVRHYVPEGPDAQGDVLHMQVLIGGRPFTFMDSPVRHDFGFTPSVSLSLTCRDRAEIERLATGLAEGGQVLMPLDSYGFSTAYAWLNDRFGVSWQLTLP